MSRTVCRGAGGLIFFGVIFACAPAFSQPGAVRSLLEIRQENVVVQQWDMSCGAAAMATVLTYQLGDRVTEKQVAQSMLHRTDPMRVRHRGGFSLLDMKRYAESRGFRADGYARLTLEHLNKLAPLIVPVNFEGYDHFVVFRGTAAGQAVLADPGFGNRSVAVEEFDKAWNGKIGFVVRRRQKTSPVNRLGPHKADFLAASNQAVRAAKDSKFPPPLKDWQMADLPWDPSTPGLMATREQMEAGALLSSAEADAVWGAGPNRELGSRAVESVSVVATPAITASGQVLDSVSGVAAPVATAVSPIAQTVSAAAAPVVQTVSNATSPVANTVGTTAQTVSSAVAPATAAIGSTVTDVTVPVTSAVSPAVQSATAAAAPVMDVAGSATQTVTGAVSAPSRAASQGTGAANPMPAGSVVQRAVAPAFSGAARASAAGSAAGLPATLGGIMHR